VDIGAWLHGLGLKQYESTFHDNDVDAEVLPELTGDDPINIGVSSFGHRRKFLAAIAVLGTERPTATSRDALASADAERRQLTSRCRTIRL
jgi:hypothetical protein